MKNGEILGLAAVGIAVWYFGFGPGKSPAVSPVLSTPNLQPGANLLNAPAGSGNLLLQATGSQSAVAIPIPGANQTAVAGTNPNATLAQQTTIFNWATGSMDAGDQARFFAAWPEMTSSDIAGLMDLIVNEWQGGQPVTPARTLFWNNWRQTYGIDV